MAARRAGMAFRRIQETTLSWPRPGPALAPAQPRRPAPKAGPQILLSFPSLCGLSKPKECLGPFIPLDHKCGQRPAPAQRKNITGKI